MHNFLHKFFTGLAIVFLFFQWFHNPGVTGVQILSTIIIIMTAICTIKLLNLFKDRYHR